MNKDVEKVYLDYVGRLKHFADDADCLTDANKSKFINLLIKEYNKDLSRIVKKESFVQRITNKLFKRRLKTEKQSFRQPQATFSCSNCVNNTKFDGLTCCIAHKLLFDSIERQQQFCAQFCRSYSQEDLSDDDLDATYDATDATNDQEDSAAVTAVDVEEQTAEEEIDKEEFVPCEKCEYCDCDENGEYYCDRYDKELDSDTIADVRQCEE